MPIQPRTVTCDIEGCDAVGADAGGVQGAGFEGWVLVYGLEKESVAFCPECKARIVNFLNELEAEKRQQEG